MLIRKGRYGIGLPRVPELRVPSMWRNVFKTPSSPPVYMYAFRMPKPPKIVKPPTQVVKRVNRNVIHSSMNQRPQTKGRGGVKGAAAVMTMGMSTGSKSKGTLTSKKVARTMQRMGLRNGSGWVSPVTHEKWVMVKGVAVKSIPPEASVSGNELRVKLNPDVVRKFASLSDNGRVQLTINLDNNRSIIVLTFDKNGKLITPKEELERMGVKVLSDGTVVLDALKALPSYYVKRTGGPHKANVAIWGRFDGVNMPVSGTTVKFKE